MDDRKRRLQEARAGFNSGRIYRVKSMDRPVKDSSNESMPYLSGYLLRTFITLFLLICLYLYGMSDRPQQQKLVTYIKENVNNNSNLKEAYAAYSNVDYQDACEKMWEYAKGIFTD